MEATPEQKKSLRRTKIAIWVILAICVVLLVTNYVLSSPPPPHKYDAFAKCVANTSTTFYGAFWCPHCAQQKTMLGTGAQYLPYHECSTPDGKGELQSCIDAGVSHYPTWVWPDGSRVEGVQPLWKISQETGCALPTSTPS